MLDRRDIASWLEGPRSTRRDAPEEPDVDHPEGRLGLPAQGAGRVAGFGPRLVAFGVDTVICAVLAAVLGRDQVWTTPIFALEVLVLTVLAGGSAGQLLTGLRVRRLDRGRSPAGRLGWGRALVRTALLVLLVPALIWDRDGRGLHDRAVGSALVHRR